MINPKNMNTWPVVFVEKDDIEAIRALDGFVDWFRACSAPDNCFGFNEQALVVYACGDKETIADYCFGNTRRFNKALQNEIEVVKRENNRLGESFRDLEIETERLRNYKLQLSPVVDKYNDLVRENVKLENENNCIKSQNEYSAWTVEDLRKKLATAEEAVKETLKIKQALFDEQMRNIKLVEKLNLQLGSLNGDNLRVENFKAKLTEKNLDQKDSGHYIRALQKGIERLKAKIAGYQDDLKAMGQGMAALRHRNKFLEASTESREREIARLKPFEGSYDRWQLENRALQEKLDNIKKSLNGFAGKI
jgi:chromosome segregation ATPase